LWLSLLADIVLLETIFPVVLIVPLELILPEAVIWVVLIFDIAPPIVKLSATSASSLEYKCSA
jgi:hypothetical protein